MKNIVVIALLMIFTVFLWHKTYDLREQIQQDNRKLALFEKKIKTIALLKKRWGKASVQNRIKVLVKRFHELKLIKGDGRWIIESARLPLKRVDKIVNSFLNSYIPIKSLSISRLKENAVYLKMELKI